MLSVEADIFNWFWLREICETAHVKTYCTLLADCILQVSSRLFLLSSYILLNKSENSSSGAGFKNYEEEINFY